MSHDELIGSARGQSPMIQDQRMLENVAVARFNDGVHEDEDVIDDDYDAKGHISQSKEFQSKPQT